MFLISSPRTASTLWCAIHADTELDDRLSTKLATGLYNREIFDCSWYTQQTVNERFEIYKSMTPRPLIKVFPGMTPNHIVEWLLDNEQAVWLERRDRLEQILTPIARANSTRVGFESQCAASLSKRVSAFTKFLHGY